MYFVRPSDLVSPPKLPSSGGSAVDGPARSLLILGAVPMIFIGTIAGGALAHALRPWLMIPGGLIGLVVMLTLVQDAGVLCGIVETIFYSGVTFIFTGGLETPHHPPASSLIAAAVVAVLFLTATYSIWKRR